MRYDNLDIAKLSLIKCQQASFLQTANYSQINSRWVMKTLSGRLKCSKALKSLPRKAPASSYCCCHSTVDLETCKHWCCITQKGDVRAPLSHFCNVITCECFQLSRFQRLWLSPLSCLLVFKPQSIFYWWRNHKIFKGFPRENYFFSPFHVLRYRLISASLFPFLGWVPALSKAFVRVNPLPQPRECLLDYFA